MALQLNVCRPGTASGPRAGLQAMVEPVSTLAGPIAAIHEAMPIAAVSPEWLQGDVVGETGFKRLGGGTVKNILGAPVRNQAITPSTDVHGEKRVWLAGVPRLPARCVHATR
jgi:hypothetical protein